MKSLFIVETVTDTSSASKPMVEEFRIPDENMISLQMVDTYLRQHHIIDDDIHVVYICAGKLLTEHTDIAVLTHPIVVYIIPQHATLHSLPRQISPRHLLTNIASNANTSSELISRINNLLVQVNQLVPQMGSLSTEIISPANVDVRIHEYSPINDTDTDTSEPDNDADPDDAEDGDAGDTEIPIVRVHESVPPNIPRLNLTHVHSFVQQLQEHVTHRPTNTYDAQITQMRDFGFNNMELILTALNIAQGDVNEAVSIYISMSET